MTPELKFYDLAHLLLEIYLESDDSISSEFKMPNSEIYKTAITLEEDFNRGLITEDENGSMYYPQMIDDYCGYYEKYIESITNQNK